VFGCSDSAGTGRLGRLEGGDMCQRSAGPPLPFPREKQREDPIAAPVDGSFPSQAGAMMRLAVTPVLRLADADKVLLHSPVELRGRTVTHTAPPATATPCGLCPT
jgi:hypothetical protein